MIDLIWLFGYQRLKDPNIPKSLKQNMYGIFKYNLNYKNTDFTYYLEMDTLKKMNTSLKIKKNDFTIGMNYNPEKLKKEIKIRYEKDESYLLYTRNYGKDKFSISFYQRFPFYRTDIPYIVFDEKKVKGKIYRYNFNNTYTCPMYAIQNYFEYGILMDQKDTSFLLKWDINDITTIKTKLNSDSIGLSLGLRSFWSPHLSIYGSTVLHSNNQWEFALHLKMEE